MAASARASLEALPAASFQSLVGGLEAHSVSGLGKDISTPAVAAVGASAGRPAPLKAGAFPQQQQQQVVLRIQVATKWLARLLTWSIIISNVVIVGTAAAIYAVRTQEVVTKGWVSATG